MRIDGLRLEFDVGRELGKSVERAIEQIGPDPLALGVAVRAFEQVFRMSLGVERRERDPSALERDPLGPLGGMRVDRRPDRLAQRCLRHILMAPQRIKFVFRHFAAVWTSRRHDLPRKVSQPFAERPCRLASWGLGDVGQ